MEARGLIQSEWGVSENNRRAKFYELTEEGRRSLNAEAESWGRYVAVVGKVLNATTDQLNPSGQTA
jgi:DNA-binding PadR family transcriptional regulator